MANELRAQSVTGRALYAAIFNAAGAVWNLSVNAWQSVSVADWSDYSLALAEQDTTGIYYADLPAALSAAERYAYLIYAQLGDTADPSDPVEAAGAVGPGSVVLAPAEDVYFADIQWTRDARSATPTDEYTVAWFKNGVPLSAGVATPTIQIVKRSDGSNLLGPLALTQIATSGVYKADGTGAARQTPGEAAIVVVSATIDGASRAWRKVVGRDLS